MANKEEQENQLINDTIKIKAEKESPEKKSWIVMPLLAVTFISTLAALLISLCALHTSKEFQKTLIVENKNFNSEIQQLKNDQINNQEEYNNTLKNAQKIQQELQTKINQLDKALQTAMNQKFYQNQDWLLLKARYYLELAQINTHWSEQLDVSVALLQQADKLLQYLNSPKIFAVRQLIAKEIAQLQALPTIDKAGLLSKLDAVQSSVGNLSIQTPSNTRNELDEKQQSTDSSWRANLYRSVNLLEKLIVVRRNDENAKPLISPLLESALRESILLSLQEAQWAVLNNNSIVYQLALKQAEKNLKRTFNDQNISAVLKQVNELQQIKLVVEKPKEDLALPALNQIIDNKEALGASESDTKMGVKGQ